MFTTFCNLSRTCKMSRKRSDYLCKNILKNNSFNRREDRI